MPVSSLAAARLICERSSWRVTNLALQKIMYLAHMVHMGRSNGARLVDTPFEAWEYGPVEPNLYRKVRIFGSRPIQDIFFSAAPIENTSEALTLNEACNHLLSKPPGELVAMTHWQNGAWAKNYLPGVRNIVIPDADILSEYRARTAAAATPAAPTA